MEKILIIEDDKWIAKMLIDKLSEKEYLVKHSLNGKEALAQLKTFIPDLVILDIMMPEMNGYEFLKIFKSTAAFVSIPVIIMSGKGKEQDIIKGFEYGADNYIIKPCSPTVMLTHIRHTLSLRKKLSGLNPLTGLPGNNAISDFTNDLLSKNKTFYFCYIDLDNFKVYNDYYGFDKGDKVLLFTAECIKKIFALDTDNFIGHIGGDDFVVIIQSEKYAEYLKTLIKEYDDNIKQFYNPNDVRNKGIVAIGRDGVKSKFGFVSLSIGVVPASGEHYHSIFEISDTAVLVKKKAKSIPGSNFYVDKRLNYRSYDDNEYELTILFTEKSSYNFRTIKHFLDPFNFNIIDISSNDDILTEYKKNEPDAIIIDREVNYLIKVVSEIRSYEKEYKLPKSYILAISEQLVQKDVIQIIKAGVDNIVIKPIDNVVILNKIKGIIKEKKEV